MVRLVCDWQSGKTPDDPRASKLPPAPENPLPIPDLLRCLNRLRKSVRFWNKEGGRQGYLEFARKYAEDEDLFDSYDPNVDPGPGEWLEIEEDERIGAILAYHERNDPDLPNPELHALLHMAVETQIALGEKPVVEALDRLRKQGLSRHDAIHAIGGTLAEDMRAIALEKEASSRYFSELAKLDAVTWLSRFSEEEGGTE